MKKMWEKEPEIAVRGITTKAITSAMNDFKSTRDLSPSLTNSELPKIKFRN